MRQTHNTREALLALPGRPQLAYGVLVWIQPFEGDKWERSNGLEQQALSGQVGRMGFISSCRQKTAVPTHRRVTGWKSVTRCVLGGVEGENKTRTDSLICSKDDLS